MAILFAVNVTEFTKDNAILMGLLLLFNQPGDINQSLADSFSLTDSMVIDIRITRNDSITITEDLTTNRILLRQFQDSYIISDTLLSKEAFKNLSDSFITSEQLTKEIRNNQSDSVTISETFNKGQDKVFSEAVTLTEGLSKHVELNKSDSMTFIDSVFEYIDRILVIISRIFGRTLNMSSSIYRNLNVDSSITSDTATIVNEIELNTMTIQSTITRNLTLNTSIG